MSVASSKIDVSTVLESIRNSLHHAGRYNPNDATRPVAILWTDQEKQWSPIIQQLRLLMPELLTYGNFAPEDKTGPSIWLRCVIEEILQDVEMPDEVIPVIYLPGISRQDLRAAEECPDGLKPLIELLYRGVSWLQKNGRDWTVEAYLLSAEGGLGLDVARDAATRRSMHLALTELITTPIHQLQGKHLEAEDFDRLLLGDQVKDMLTWLSAPDRISEDWTESKWAAFKSRSLADYQFDPEKDGELIAGERLMKCQEAWSSVWERFAEAPALYPGIPTLLRKIEQDPGDLFEDHSTWPQHNEAMESQLRRKLLETESVAASDILNYILELDKIHGPRRDWVWTRLGQASLAEALRHLVIIAEGTAKSLGGTTKDEMAAQYTTGAWQVDLAVLDALATVKSDADKKAVETAIRRLYLPWLEGSTNHFQKLLDDQSIPDAKSQDIDLVTADSGSLILFIDGLRLDIAQRFIALMNERGWESKLGTRWVGLPTVTATAKPAVSPVADRLSGTQPGEDFLPIITDTGQALNPHHFRKVLGEAGYQYVPRDEVGDPSRRGWTEYGEFDKLGHTLGTHLADRINEQLSLLLERIQRLFETGWKSIRIVTDHGWLLMPGGLPKVDLPKYLTESRWHRCASIKGESKVQVPTTPWYWNPDVQVAIAPGVSCFRDGQEYDHGGASLQECLVPDIEVTPGDMAQQPIIVISQLKWFGLRCRIQLQEPRRGLRVDLRTRVNDPTSSVTQPKTIDPEEGSASLFIEDDSLESKSATVVLIDEGGYVVAKKPTIIGGED